MKARFPLLFLAATALLASCGNNPSTSHATGLSTSSAPSAMYLDWVADNKIVIDLFEIGDARFTYGNAALNQQSQTLDLNDNAAFAFTSQEEKDQTYSFVFVTEVIKPTGFKAAAAIYPGIEGDKLVEFLRDNTDLREKTRAYVAISYGSTVMWTKGKNAAMDAKIQQLVDASK